MVFSEDVEIVEFCFIGIGDVDTGWADWEEFWGGFWGGFWVGFWLEFWGGDCAGGFAADGGEVRLGLRVAFLLLGDGGGTGGAGGVVCGA